MEEVGLFERYASAASIAATFAGLGGDCDEFMQFLQLEWESYADEPSKKAVESFFYAELKDYKKLRGDVRRDWRESFDGRNHFGTIV